MLLNRLWIAMFVIAMIMGVGKFVFLQDTEIFKVIVQALFDSVKNGFELILGLVGALCLWMGIMNIGEKSGVVNLLSKLVNPLFCKLFPEIPKDHPAQGAIMMNYSANMLGLDNAATPIGLKAMNYLQELNPNKETASNAQIMFLVLNTSGLTIIPVSILAYRSGAMSKDPTVVFMPILIATFFSTMAGLIFLSIKQKINLLQPVVLAYLGGMAFFIFGLLAWCIYHPGHIQLISDVGGNFILLSVIVLFIVLGVRKKINVYDAFIEGAKGGFEVALTVLPYVIGILAAVSVFRASGAMQVLFDGIAVGLTALGVKTLSFIEALPVAFMKPFSGPGARAMMLETFKIHGVDSFLGKLASTFQGCTDTTFYILAVYFGSVGIKKMRYAPVAGLVADFSGFIASIFLAYMFY
jgi:spore maturation protein SpmA/spore maturation protein SpmB